MTVPAAPGAGGRCWQGQGSSGLLQHGLLRWKCQVTENTSTEMTQTQMKAWPPQAPGGCSGCSAVQPLCLGLARASCAPLVSSFPGDGSEQAHAADFQRVLVNEPCHRAQRAIQSQSTQRIAHRPKGNPLRGATLMERGILVFPNMHGRADDKLCAQPLLWLLPGTDF